MLEYAENQLAIIFEIKDGDKTKKIRFASNNITRSVEAEGIKRLVEAYKTLVDADYSQTLLSNVQILHTK